MCSIRDYQPAGFEACLHVFRSNMPLFFGAEEEAEFAAFLAQSKDPYFVAELAGQVVGCGGYYPLPDEGLAGLAWGMVARNHQCQGIGTALLQARLQRLATEPSVRAVRVNTNHHTAAFFERFGFQTERIVENHFAAGLHQHRMLLRLPENR